MNITELKVEMLRHSDNVDTLAAKMTMSRATMYYKMSGRSDFTRSDIERIKEIYSLSPERVNEIFFTNEVS